LPDIVHICTV